MTTHVALPLTDEYLKLSNEIVEKLQDKKSPSQAHKTVKTTQLLIDYMFSILVDDLIDQVPMKPWAEKIVHQVSSVVQKALHVLISNVISKLDNAELKPLVNHFKECEIEHEGEYFLGFQLDDASEQKIYACMAHLRNKEIKACKTLLVELLETVVDQTLELFLLKPLSLVRLGMISRKLVDLTAKTIEKAVPPAIDKIIGHMEVEELQLFESFLLSLLIMEE